MKFNLTSARDLVDLAKKLTVGLSNLTFDDNMETYKVENLKILPYDASKPNQNVVTIGNKLTFVPTQYIITSQEGNGLVTKTGTWSNKFLHLINNGSSEVTITVIFMR